MITSEAGGKQGDTERCNTIRKKTDQFINEFIELYISFFRAFFPPQSIIRLLSSWKNGILFFSEPFGKLYAQKIV